MMSHLRFVLAAVALAGALWGLNDTAVRTYAVDTADACDNRPPPPPPPPRPTAVAAVRG